MSLPLRLRGLAPIVSASTRLLVLGSFPGAASLASQQYYAHPQNQFWKILEAIWPSRPYVAGLKSYEKRSEWLLERGLGVWDVYASCERDGSLDTAIRHAETNDFASLLSRCPNLHVIAHNGAESFKHAPRVLASLSAASASGGVAMSAAGPPQGAKAPSGGSAAHAMASVGVPAFKLPSTSPANASWCFERKLAAWREVIVAAGLA